MTLPRPAHPDALRPSLEQVAAAWAARVRADHQQVERCREIEDPADYYAPHAHRFAQAPDRHDDPALETLLALARDGETWLDIGAGGGRYALPLARRAGHVIAVEPSPAMRAVLHDGMALHAIGGIEIIEDRWPMPGMPPPPTADVALMAHVGYDIEAIVPFVSAADDAARRLCVAVMGEGAMTTVASLLWEPVHGEPRVPLPALPEMLGLLLALGRLPAVSLTERRPSTTESFEELVDLARRQLWVRPGSARDDHLIELLGRQASQRDEGWALDWRSTRVGIVSWVPGDADGSLTG
jgi:SAM-dependent methyltransferase